MCILGMLIAFLLAGEMMKSGIYRILRIVSILMVGAGLILACGQKKGSGYSQKPDSLKRDGTIYAKMTRNSGGQQLSSAQEDYRRRAFEIQNKKTDGLESFDRTEIEALKLKGISQQNSDQIKSINEDYYKKAEGSKELLKKIAKVQLLYKKADEKDSMALSYKMTLILETKKNEVFVYKTSEGSHFIHDLESERRTIPLKGEAGNPSPSLGEVFLTCFSSCEKLLVKVDGDNKDTLGLIFETTFNLNQEIQETDFLGLSSVVGHPGEVENFRKKSEFNEIYKAISSFESAINLGIASVKKTKEDFDSVGFIHSSGFSELQKQKSSERIEKNHGEMSSYFSALEKEFEESQKIQKEISADYLVSKKVDPAKVDMLLNKIKRIKNKYLIDALDKIQNFSIQNIPRIEEQLRELQGHMFNSENALEDAREILLEAHPG